MCEKTVIGAFLMHGHVPMSAEMRSLLMREDAIEGAVSDAVTSATLVTDSDDH